MSTDTFFAYYDAFEDAAISGDFDAVGALLTDDVTYRVSGVPFACELHGRAAVIAGMKHSLAGFDARLDGRWLGIRGLPREEDGALRVELLSAYRKDGAPDLHFTVTERLRFRDGRIHDIEDAYTPEIMAPAVRWLGEHGAGLDPSYV